MVKPHTLTRVVSGVMFLSMSRERERRVEAEEIVQDIRRQVSALLAR